MTTDALAAPATIDSLSAQIKSMETEIKTLEAQIKRLQTQVMRLRLSVPVKSFADLEGILAGQADFSEEEIDAALYRFEWEGESSDEMTE
jgi:septal ring factor EnvC (AmiA/AmiB activator)